jgi:hypothetical protein
MSMPGFTAATSFYKTSGYYQTSRHAISVPTQIIRGMLEIIEVHDCPPGHLAFGEGENMTCVPVRSFPGHEGPSLPRPPRNGNGNGNGGGGDPVASDTVNMDEACNPANALKKCGLLSPSINRVCALLLCRRDYCGDHECTPDEVEKSKQARGQYKDKGCDSFPCPPTKRSSVSNVRSLLTNG